MVKTIHGGGAGFNALIYQPPDERLLNYFNTNIQRVANVVGDISTQFVDTTRALYDKFNSSSVIAASKALIYGVGDHTNQNMIYPLGYENVGNANIAMQQYVMAHPEVSSLHEDNMCDGYESMYFNQEPEVFGKDRMDYQRVMDGVVQYDEDGMGYVMRYTNTDDTTLDTFDQFAILDTWRQVERLIAEGIDPTDPERGDL